MNSFIFAMRQLRSAWRAGEVRVLLAALVLAVGAMSAVGLFADRIESALIRQGGLLLGADLQARADHPLPESWSREAAGRGLRTVPALEFPSMAMHGEQSQLAEIKAVGAGYPLRGQLMVSAAPYAVAHLATSIPRSGEVWLEPRLAGALHAGVGDTVTLGERDFTVSAILSQEPARGGDLFSIAPRLLMRVDDVPATGLVQYGSRISYRLLVAGSERAVADYSDWLRSQIGRGERVEDVRNARPEVRNALDKARQFLGLASMASVILAMVAMALAMMRHAQRHLDTCALLRCFGASQGTIVRIFLWQILVLGVLGGLLGCLLGYAAQEFLSRFAGTLFLERLPAPTWSPAWSSMLAGLAALLGTLLPQLLRLRGVPALRILRRDLEGTPMTGWLGYLPALAVWLGLLFWSARDARLGWIMLAGLAVLLLLATLAALLLGRWLRAHGGHLGGAWRLGFANLLRRPGVSIAQVAGFSLGLMAMLLLTLVRGDLLASWQSSLPPDAPNRFVINIQPDQLQAVQAYLAESGLAPPGIFPMVRGRLVAVNGNPLDPEKYADDRARRLASREFNLSWAKQMQADNRIVAGRWWQPQEHGQPLLSMEQGIAEALGLHMSDVLTYDIGGSRIDLRVQSLRTVEWDTMRPNFFAMTPPGVLDGYPATYITSIHVPATQESVLNHLVRRFPNVTIIDVAAILEQVRGIMDRMAYAVQFMFGFSLLSGIAVLYAALTASGRERRLEVAQLRVLGAGRRQVLAAVLAEFVCIGLLSGCVAAIGSGALAWTISVQLLHLPYSFNPLLAVLAVLGGVTLVPAAAWLGLRRTLRYPPWMALQSA